MMYTVTSGWEQLLERSWDPFMGTVISEELAASLPGREEAFSINAHFTTMAAEAVKVEANVMSKDRASRFQQGAW